LNQFAVFFASFAGTFSLHAIAVHISFQYREFSLVGRLLLQAAGYISTFP
jgi:hypothetical protein